MPKSETVFLTVDTTPLEDASRNFHSLPLHIRVYPKARKKIDQLAEKHGLSLSQTIRILIDYGIQVLEKAGE